MTYPGSSLKEIVRGFEQSRNTNLAIYVNPNQDLRFLTTHSSNFNNTVKSTINFGRSVECRISNTWGQIPWHAAFSLQRINNKQWDNGSNGLWTFHCLVGNLLRRLWRKAAVRPRNMSVIDCHLLSPSPSSTRFNFPVVTVQLFVSILMVKYNSNYFFSSSYWLAI